MNNKELKKLNRKELLEILVSQANLIQSLEKELEETKKELDNRNIVLKEAGSIAEASLKLSGIFEKAQEVADQYLNSIMENKDILIIKNSQQEKNLNKNYELKDVKSDFKMVQKIKKTRRRKITA